MSARKILLDTGIIVAGLNQQDPDHRRVVDWLTPVRAAWFSTEGVLVEATHLLRKTRDPLSRVVGFVTALRCQIVPINARVLARAVQVAAAHPRLKLDLVDALLCAIGEVHQIDELASLDRRDSLAIRRPGRPPFIVHPGPA
ncbi:MAG: hypothetical protein AMXMBFR34_23680 [Myxococcaceae bacterium]